MEPRANYALIGAFVIFSCVALMGFLLWIGQNQFRQTFDEYDIVFEGPVTLDEGAAVRYIGVNVGEVRWVRIDRADPSRVRARIRIDSETPVKTDSTATIDFAGITGVTFVQINAGSPNAPALRRQPGQPVPVIEAERTPLSEIISSGRRILGEASETVQRVNNLLTDENIESLSKTLVNIETITRRLAEDDGLLEHADAALIEARDAARNFGEAGATLQAVGEEADLRIARLGDEVSTLVADAGETLAGFRRAGEEAERAAGEIATVVEGPGTAALTDIRLAAQDLRRLTSRLERLAREIESNPQAIIVGESLPYEEARP